MAFEKLIIDFGQEKDNIDFNELKENISETISCVLKAIEYKGKKNIFSLYKKSNIFINFILGNKAQLNSEIIKNSIILITNIYDEYGKNI